MKIVVAFLSSRIGLGSKVVMKAHWNVRTNQMLMILKMEVLMKLRSSS